MRALYMALLLSTTAIASDDDLKYLAEAIYHEARGEPRECREMLAQAILTRVEQPRYPDTIEGVVHQKRWAPIARRWSCQFSYHCDSIPDTPPYNDEYKESWSVASWALSGNNTGESYADHFYAHNKTTPLWSPDLRDPLMCGNHTFGSLPW